jgi:fructose/tagatose bisphosphate aldolase
LGCAKVNISTKLKYAFIDSFVDYHRSHSTEYNPLKVLHAQFDAMQEAVAANIVRFGSAGHG